MLEEPTNLVELLEQSCKAYAQRRLFGIRRDGAWRWTSYAQFKRLVDDFRAGLATLGIGPQDRVGLISDNRIEWAAAAYATYGLKATLVPMFEQQKPEDWRFILADCGARVVICATAQMVENLEAARQEIRSLEHVVGLSLPDRDDRSYAALLKQGAAAPRAAQQPDSDDLAGLIYTSGTTGNPKGVMLTHRNICSNVSGIHAVLRFEPDDRSLSFLPWAHVFGQTAELHDLISTGSAIAINDDLANLVANLAVVKPTVLFAVPRIFNRIYDGVNRQIAQKPRAIQQLFHSAIKTAARRRQGQEAGALDRFALALADRILFSRIRSKFGGRLKYAVSGSAALSREVGEFVDALGIAVFEGYGLTETSPIVSTNCPGASKLGSVGKPLPGVQVRIDQVSDCDDPFGEIVVLGPNVMRGYYNRVEENRQAFTADGGLRTGDLGYLDRDGYLHVTGRIKEQYKLENGKYVVPSPLEEALKLSPFIANVMLYGANRPHNIALVVPDSESLQRWAAQRDLELDELTTNQHVLRLIEQELADRSSDFKSFERPRAFHLVVEDFTTENGLMTPSLKLKRRKVLDQYQELLESLYH